MDILEQSMLECLNEHHYTTLIMALTWKFQLICNVTPASSNMEETHNTLKFASRAKRVEIYASRNKVHFIIIN
jgi:hypothetical protein